MHVCICMFVCVYVCMHENACVCVCMRPPCASLTFKHLNKCALKHLNGQINVHFLTAKCPVKPTQCFSKLALNACVYTCLYVHVYVCICMWRRPPYAHLTFKRFSKCDF